jgi:hypothetical protein
MISAKNSLRNMEYTEVKATPIFGIHCDSQEPAHRRRKGDRELGHSED